MSEQKVRLYLSATELTEISTKSISEILSRRMTYELEKIGLGQRKIDYVTKPKIADGSALGFSNEELGVLDFAPAVIKKPKSPAKSPEMLRFEEGKMTPIEEWDYMKSQGVGEELLGPKPSN